MTPIHEVLSRIRWDPAFADGEFELGYFDRVKDAIIIVPFRQVEFPPESPASFELLGADGKTYLVPFHRVREVYKDGKRIWHRE